MISKKKKKDTNNFERKESSMSSFKCMFGFKTTHHITK